MTAHALPMNRLMKSATALVAVSAMAFGLATPLTSRAQSASATGTPLVPPAPGLEGREGPGESRGHRGPGGASLMALMSPKAGARLMDVLKLDDTQRSKIEAIRTRMRTQMEQQRRTHVGLGGPGDLQRQMMTALTQPVVDTAAVHRLQQQELSRIQQFSEQRTQSLTEMAQVLTPEQRTQLAGLLQARWDRKGPPGMHGPGPGPGADRPAAEKP